MTAPRHQIRREILEVTVPDREASWRLQSELSRIHAQRVEAIVDRCFYSRLENRHRLQ